MARARAPDGRLQGGSEITEGGTLLHVHGSAGRKDRRALDTKTISCMALVDALAALEAQTTGVSEMPPLESSHVDRFKQVVEAGGGLPIERDCRKEILGVNEADLVEVILPLCTWLKGITQGPSGKGEQDIDE